jgi:hypothetical protein
MRESAIYFRMIEFCEVLELGICEVLESVTYEVLESGLCEVRESGEVLIWELQ